MEEMKKIADILNKDELLHLAYWGSFIVFLLTENSLIFCLIQTVLISITNNRSEKEFMIRFAGLYAVCFVCIVGIFFNTSLWIKGMFAVILHGNLIMFAMKEGKNERRINRMFEKMLEKHKDDVLEDGWETEE